MAATRIDLYRIGNASGPRLDHVRERDIVHVVRQGVTWVRAGTGGVSTFDTPGPLRGRWWVLSAGYDYGPLLIVWNDHGSHWSWEPARDMPLTEYRTLLGAANGAFR